MTRRSPRHGTSPQDLRRFNDALARQPQGGGRFAAWLRRVIAAWFRLVGWRIDVRVAPLPGDRVPGAGCLVVAAPHRAWVEPFLLQAAWPADGARLVWLADSRTLLTSWWRRRLLPRVGVLPVGRGVGDPRSYARLAAEVLAAGHALVVFPEVGPPSASDRTRRISPGFAYLALGSGAPIVPVVIGGTHRIVRGSSFSLDILTAVAPEPVVDDPFTPPARRRAHELTERYRETVERLLVTRNAAIDEDAPAVERWRWLGRLFG